MFVSAFKPSITIYWIAFYAVFLPVIGQKSFANTPVATAAAPQAPRPIAQAIEQARKWGQSRLVVFGFSIYDAKLWAESSFTPANYSRSDFALEIRYLRNFTGAALSERSIKEMRRLGTVSDAQAQMWLEQMNATFPDVKKGDQLIGIHRADGTSSFVMNGRPIGDVKDSEFNRLFFGIWLSPQSSEPKMRRELIGAAGATAATSAGSK